MSSEKVVEPALKDEPTNSVVITPPVVTPDSRRAEIIVEVTKARPSVFELSHLATALTFGRDIQSVSLAASARKALALWKACQEELAADIDLEVTKIVAMEAMQGKPSKVPQPAEFPLSLDDFLALLLGAKKEEDRYALFRGFLTETFDPKKWISKVNETFGGMGGPFQPPEPSDWAAEAIGEFKRTKITEKRYRELAPAFLQWCGRERAKKATERAHKGASVRWSGSKQDQAI